MTEAGERLIASAKAARKKVGREKMFEKARRVGSMTELQRLAQEYDAACGRVEANSKESSE